MNAKLMIKKSMLALLTLMMLFSFFAPAAAHGSEEAPLASVHFRARS